MTATAKIMTFLKMIRNAQKIRLDAKTSPARLATQEFGRTLRNAVTDATLQQANANRRMILTTLAALPASTNVQLQIHHFIVRMVSGLLTNTVLMDVICRQENVNPPIAHMENINATDQRPIQFPTIAITDFGECMKHAMKVASLPQENAKNPVIK